VDCGGRTRIFAKALCAQAKLTNSALGGPVAQWSEPAAHNRLVGGSSPSGPTKIFQYQ
jgi:hypothetical protein